MAHRISTLFILPAAALLAITTGTSTAAAQGVAHGDFMFTTGANQILGLRNPPTGKCLRLVMVGASSGTNATDAGAHIYATSDCQQQLTFAPPGNPGRGTAWNTPDFTPSAHSVRFDCDSPGVC
ncbi:hypothetical protein [Streptomyces sp. CBMA152]|uniref:hypothetical protein n=1 Tax=Streptomyces sp. CBMA152 TaxID=1896312 RepID=UPI001660C2DC|nr:hypothetical protein [Streptomyces sp. CBMA152]MBD0741245.1 hypothetical protein [Streptomyces sp. CBMA152]